jgi:hypothetical protein
VLVINFVHAKPKIRARKARMNMLKARRKEVRMMAIEMGTIHVSHCTERRGVIVETYSGMPIQDG